MKAPYDILKKDAIGAPIWVEAVEDLEQATSRVRDLAQRSPGEYVVFSQEKSQIIVTYLRALRRLLPSNERNY